MEITDLDDIAVVKTDERLDAVVALSLKDAVRKLAEDESKVKVIIDLGNTRFIDSSGCGALVASLRVLMKCNGDMKIARPSVQAKSLFELTRLHRVFEVFDDLETAAASFRKTDAQV